MTDLELERQARQRVMNFLSAGTINAEVADLEAPSQSDLASVKIPASIAEQTAADLMKFLRSGMEN